MFEQKAVDGNLSNKIFLRWSTFHISWVFRFRFRASLVRISDWTLLLRKRRWNDCHYQFGDLWSHYNRLFFACYWRIRLGEYVVSFSWPSLDRLYQYWTCVLLIVDSPNATVNIYKYSCTFNFICKHKTQYSFFHPFVQIVKHWKQMRKPSICYSRIWT